MRFYNANRNENKFLVLGYECEYKISITKKNRHKKSLQSQNQTTGNTPKWALTDSNRRPSACKADALNQLS